MKEEFPAKEALVFEGKEGRRVGVVRLREMERGRWWEEEEEGLVGVES